MTTYNKLVVNGVTKFDCSGVTAAASDVASGKTFVNANGAITTGTHTDVSYDGMTVLYDNTLTVSSFTSTTATLELTISTGSLTGFNLLFVGISRTASTTTAGYFLRRSEALYKYTGTYPNKGVGYTVVANSSGSVTSFSTSYGLYSSLTSTSVKIYARCSSSNVTKIDGTFRIVVVGVE